MTDSLSVVSRVTSMPILPESPSTKSGRSILTVSRAAPNQYNPNLFPIGDGFGLFVFFDRYETTHFRNGVKKQPTSKPRGPRKKKQTP